MTKKRKVVLRLSEDELAIVGHVDLWSHLVEVYSGLGEIYPDDQAGWDELADWINEALQKYLIERYVDED